MKKPTLEEIDRYCNERHASVDPVAFFLHYETNGWMVGKVPMKNWKAGIANWDRMQQTRNGGNRYAKAPDTFAERDATGTRQAIERAREDRQRIADHVNALGPATERRPGSTVAQRLLPVPDSGD